MEFDNRIVGGDLSVEVDGSTDDARWFGLDELASIRRVELVNTAIDLWRHATIADTTNATADNH